MKKYIVVGLALSARRLRRMPHWQRRDMVCALETFRDVSSLCDVDEQISAPNSNAD